MVSKLASGFLILAAVTVLTIAMCLAIYLPVPKDLVAEKVQGGLAERIKDLTILQPLIQDFERRMFIMLSQQREVNISELQKVLDYRAVGGGVDGFLKPATSTTSSKNRYKSITSRIIFNLDNKISLTTDAVGTIAGIVKYFDKIKQFASRGDVLQKVEFKIDNIIKDVKIMLKKPTLIKEEELSVSETFMQDPDIIGNRAGGKIDLKFLTALILKRFDDKKSITDVARKVADLNALLKELNGVENVNKSDSHRLNVALGGIVKGLEKVITLKNLKPPPL
jgi:hypothetical protein